MAALAVGAHAPNFSAETHDGTALQLSELLEHSAVVLFFYPRDFTPGCTAEACAFRDDYTNFVEAGATVVGVSADSGESHRRFAQHHNLPFALISDADGALRKAYGVDKVWGVLPGRVTFVIDRQGVVRNVFDSALFARRHSGDALAKVARLIREDSAQQIAS